MSRTFLWLLKNIMMPGSKGLNPHELAHKWMKDLGTRLSIPIKMSTFFGNSEHPFPEK